MDPWEDKNSFRDKHLGFPRSEAKTFFCGGGRPGGGPHASGLRFARALLGSASFWLPRWLLCLPAAAAGCHQRRWWQLIVTPRAYNRPTVPPCLATRAITRAQLLLLSRPPPPPPPSQCSPRARLRLVLAPWRAPRVSAYGRQPNAARMTGRRAGRCAVTMSTKCCGCRAHPIRSRGRWPPATPFEPTCRPCRDRWTTGGYTTS